MWIEGPCLGEAEAVEAFDDEADEAAAYVADGFHFATFACGDGGSIFCGNHAEEALAEFSVEDEGVERWVQMAGENESCECGQVQEYVCEWVEHFSEVADLVMFAGKVAVEVIGEFCENQKWDADAAGYD